MRRKSGRRRRTISLRAVEAVQSTFLTAFLAERSEEACPSESGERPSLGVPLDGGERAQSDQQEPTGRRGVMRKVVGEHLLGRTEGQRRGGGEDAQGSDARHLGS